MHADDDMLTTSQVGKKLGYSSDTIRVWCDDDKDKGPRYFPGRRRTRGGHWRIPMADVTAFIEATKPKKRVRAA